MKPKPPADVLFDRICRENGIEFNKQVNKIRSMIERVIANFKTWRIVHTDYRRPIDTFATTISAVIGLHFWREA